MRAITGPPDQKAAGGHAVVRSASACTEAENAASPASTGTGPGAGILQPTPAPTTSDSTSATWPGARAVREENAKPGEATWAAGITEPPSTRVEGFAGRARVAPGESLPIFIHSLDGPVVVKAYRIGWLPVPERGWSGRRPM